MCLAVPSRIVSIHESGESAVMETLGVRQEAIIALLDENVEPGDYVLVHAGFAIRKIDIEEARKTLQLHEELRTRQIAHSPGKTHREQKNESRKSPQ